MKKLSRLYLLAGLSIGSFGQLGAVIITGSSGSLSASADFNVVAGNLVVTLTNTSANDVLVPVDVLTGVFFNVAGNPSLVPGSALLGGSTVLHAAAPAGGNVGGEWTLGQGLAGAPGGASKGISSAGFGLFGNFNFNGPDLDPPDAVNGLNYGITSAGDNGATGNSPVTTLPLIQNSVIFTMSGLPAGFSANLDTITGVWFQYGTALSEPSFPGTSVPDGGSTLALLGGALVLLGGLYRRGLSFA